MEDQEIYGLEKEEPWPYEYLVWALQYLSLSPEEMDAYLPEKFPATKFHILNGDMETMSAIDAMHNICLECVHACQYQSDWDKDPKIDEGIDANLATLMALIWELDAINPPESLQTPNTVSANEFVHKRSECREVAVETLKLMGLHEEKIEPVFAAKDLLDEWSYGQYGYNVEGGSRA